MPTLHTVIDSRSGTPRWVSSNGTAITTIPEGTTRLFLGEINHASDEVLASILKALTASTISSIYLNFDGEAEGNFSIELDSKMRTRARTFIQGLPLSVHSIGVTSRGFNYLDSILPASITDVHIMPVREGFSAEHFLRTLSSNPHLTQLTLGTPDFSAAETSFLTGRYLSINEILLELQKNNTIKSVDLVRYWQELPKDIDALITALTLLPPSVTQLSLHEKTIANLSKAELDRLGTTLSHITDLYIFDTQGNPHPFEGEIIPKDSAYFASLAPLKSMGAHPKAIDASAAELPEENSDDEEPAFGLKEKIERLRSSIGQRFRASITERLILSNWPGRVTHIVNDYLITTEKTATSAAPQRLFSSSSSSSSSSTPLAEVSAEKKEEQKPGV